MVHIKKPIHHLKSCKNKYVVSLLSISCFIVVAIGIFSTTKGKDPSLSELAFTEYSTLGKSAGSVIPASCESSPVAYHSTDYSNVLLISDFSCYRPPIENPVYVGTISQVNGEAAYAKCQQMAGTGGLIQAVPGTASCPTPTVKLFFSAK